MDAREILKRSVVEHLRDALTEYKPAVEQTVLSRQTKNARIYNVQLFLRWLEGEYDPSSEV